MQNSFESHEIALFRQVIDVVCAERGGCDAETENYIALKIFSRAQSGNWDFITLLKAARCETDPALPRNKQRDDANSSADRGITSP